MVKPNGHDTEVVYTWAQVQEIVRKALKNQHGSGCVICGKPIEPGTDGAPANADVRAHKRCVERH